jgi:hypothetical protein
MHSPDLHHLQKRAALQFDRVKKQAFLCFEIGGATTRFWPRDKQNRKSLADQSPLPTIRDAQKAAGVRLPPLLTRAKRLSSALLTAALLATAAGLAAPAGLAAATLLLALALLAFTFLSLPIVLLAAALLSLTGRPLWFVWIPLCFHIAFQQCIIELIDPPPRAMRPNLSFL